MITVPIVETLKKADKAYCDSVSVKRLDEALLALSDLNADICSELNWQRTRRLDGYIKIKLAVIKFFKGKLEQINLDVAKKSIDRAKSILPDSDLSWVESVKDIMRQTVVFMTSVYEGYAAVMSKHDRLFDTGRYLETLEIIDDKLKELGTKDGAFIEFIDIFPDAETGKIAFFSVNEEVRKALYGCRNEMRLAFESSASPKNAVFDTLGQFDKYSLCPDYTINIGGEHSPILFVSTPLENEFTFLLNVNKSVGFKQRNIVQLNTGWWGELCSKPDGKDSAKERADEVRDLFLGILMQADYRKNTDIFAVYGLSEMSLADVRGVLIACSDYVKKSDRPVKFVINDGTGNLGLLEFFNGIRQELSLCAAENVYLSLPSFNSICEYLKLIGTAELQALHKQGVFLGYVGISVLIEQFKNGDPLWREEYIATSRTNFAKSRRFLDELADDSRYVPVDWNWTSEVKKPEQIDVKYDYDKIRDVLDARIEEIIANEDYDIYRRCEELVLYCLCADEDLSVWERIDDDEKKSRVARATRVIATAMRCYYSNPDVEFCDTDEGRWGGRCCGGGQLIQYKVKDIQDVEWTRDAVLHELYHSIQHTMMSSNLSLKWYKKTYHVSEERLQSWRDNNGCYINSDKHHDLYWVQTMEVDARDYACMCLGDKIYHSVRLK